MNKKPSNRRALVASACTVLLLFVPNCAQYQPSPLAHLVMPAFELDSAQFSMLFSAAMTPGILLSMVCRFAVRPVWRQTRCGDCRDGVRGSSRRPRLRISVEWKGNESVGALRKPVSGKPLTIQMSMYGDFEQVGSLGSSFQAATSRQRPPQEISSPIRAARSQCSTDRTHGRIRGSGG
jgi:hypothetical protein